MMKPALLRMILLLGGILLSGRLLGGLALSTERGWRATHAPNTLERVAEEGPLQGWLHFRSPKWRGPKSDWPAFEGRGLPRDWTGHDRLALPVLCDSLSGTHLFAVFITDGERRLQKGAHYEFRLQHPQARMVVLPLSKEFQKKRVDARNISVLHIYTENPPSDQSLFMGRPVLLKPGEPAPVLPLEIQRLARCRKLSLLKPLLDQMKTELNRRNLDQATAVQANFWKQRKKIFLEKLYQGDYGEFLLTHGLGIPDYQTLLALPEVFASSCSRLDFSGNEILLGRASSASKVLPRVPVFRPLPEKLKLSAARNESEALQLVVMPLDRSLSEVTVSFTDFSCGGMLLPPTALQAIPVGFVETRFNPPNGSPHVGFWPDPLLTFLKRVDIRAGEAQPFWIRAAIPAGQAPGIYGGEVRLCFDGREVRRIPLTVTVRNFTLPNHSLLPLAVTFGPTVRKHPHRMEVPTTAWRKHMVQWHEMLVGYYLNFDHLYWSAPDNAYFPFWQAMVRSGRPAAFNLGNFHLASGNARNNYGMQKVIDRIAPVYQRARQLGLLKDAYIYGADEAQKATFPQLEKAAEILKRHFPGVPVMTTAADDSYGTDGAAPSISRFCPLISNYNRSQARLARSQGREVWWYVSNTIAPPYPNNFVESDAVEIRLLMGAMAHKYDVDGFLYYYTSMWNTDEPIVSGPYTGMDARSYPRYNGDGNWCYQGPDNTPLATIRLENFRDGLEDFAYLKILQQRLLAAEERQFNQPWRKEAEKMLEISPELVENLTRYSRNPENLLAWREELARLIEAAPLQNLPVLDREAAIAQRNALRQELEKRLHPPVIVQKATGYNSWPMIQNLPDRLVCAYSKGSDHTIADGLRGTFARYSRDGGKTWSAESLVVNTPQWGNVPIGKGLDSRGNMLLWVRSWGETHHHDLFRTADGVLFEKIATVTPDPMPMQITDIIQLPGTGLMALWFTGDYSQGGRNAWGTLVSRDDGITWKQQVIERNLPREQWPTEPSAVYLGNGRILAVSRTECPQDAPGTAQFQLESRDYGRTWSKAKTNITDVAFSTPSLILDRKKGLISNYYYIRGKGRIMRRTAGIDQVWGKPENWPEPELLALSSDSFWDAGNVNATVRKEKHIVAFYAGNSTHTAVQIITVDAP